MKIFSRVQTIFKLKNVWYYEIKTSCSDQILRQTEEKLCRNYKLIHSIYGEASMSQTTTYEWYNRFENGQTSMEDDSRNGRPKGAIKEEKVDAVQHILEKSWVAVRMIADKLNISKVAFRKF